MGNQPESEGSAAADREELMEKLGEFPEPAGGEEGAPSVQEESQAEGRMEVEAQVEVPKQEEVGGAAPERGRNAEAILPLPIDPAVFWAFGDETALEDLHGRGLTPEGSPGAALAKRLGAFPFWRGEEGFQEVMDRAYARIVKAGVEVLHGPETGH